MRNRLLPPTDTMSSYRPPFRRYPDRDAEKREAARKAEAEQKRNLEMNAANFPTLSTARPLSDVSGNKFAKLAQQWAVEDEVDRRMTDYKKQQQAADRRDKEEIMSHRMRRQYARHDQHEELAPLPEEVTRSNLGIEDDVGWTQPKRKSYKPKRELTVDELDARARQDDEDGREDDFNGHLFESNRHDHDRV